MSKEEDPHPSLEQLAAFDSGCLPALVEAAVEAHVSACAKCCQALEGLPEDPLVALVRAYGVGPPAPPPAPAGEETAWEIPPELVGHPRYRILGVLGSGGMGVVYKAVQRHTDRVVALKVLAPKLQTTPDFVERFRREVRAVARLQHPNIVLAFDADEAGGLHFIVMEYVEGVGLDRLVQQKGPLPIPEACDCARQAALGLQHAHEKGTVHRDVKPHNLLLTPAGRVKVVDFGLARLVTGDGEPATPVSSPPLLGAPDYAAPEQARDPAHVDIRADVYSLGCTLYFLLTGQPPFPRGTPLQKLLLHQESPPRPVSDLRPEVPAPLAQLLGRMLAKDPNRRPATPGAVAEELAALLGSGPAPSLQAKRVRRFPHLVLGTALGVAALATAVALAWPRGDHPETDKGEPKPASAAQAPAPSAPAGRDDGFAPERKSGDALLAWVRVNNRWGPASGVVTDVARDVEKTLGKYDGFQLALGPGLVKSGKATLLVSRFGEFFPFEPPPEQAGPLGVKGAALRLLRYYRGEDIRRARPRIRISDLWIDQGGVVPRGSRLTGRLAYQLLEPVAEDLHVRLTYYPSGGWMRTMGMFYLHGPLRAERGEVAFNLPGPSVQYTKNDRLLVFFVELASQRDRREVIESNTLATLIQPR
jgi:hypothetical protein